MQNEIRQTFTTWLNPGFISLILNLVWIICIWFSRNFIREYFIKSIQNKFDEKLEKTRSELRHNENEISDIRKTILNNISSKSEAIWMRKIKAIDNLWNSFVELKANYISVVDMLSRLNIDELATRSDDPTIKFALNQPYQLSGIENIDLKKSFHISQESIPWINYQVRAVFEAYVAIGGLAITQIVMLKRNIYDTKFLRIKEVSEMFITLFPELKIKPEQINNTLYPICLKILEQRLLNEIKQMVECDSQLEVDSAINAIQKINVAMDAVKRETNLHEKNN